MHTTETRALNPVRLLAGFALALILIAALLPRTASADAHEEQGGRMRAAAVQIEARVVDIDYESREFTLELPHGQFVTMTAGPDVQRLDEIKVGDSIVATYLTSLAGEVRKPTEEELANPWQELDVAAVAGAEQRPGVAGGRAIKAVCTIEGMNRVAGTVMIEDPRGKYHLIGDVPREAFEGRMLGETIIVVYTEAVALSVAKAGDSAAE